MPSTLEKTIAILETLPESKLNQVYDYAANIGADRPRGHPPVNVEEAFAYFRSVLAGIPDDGKTLEEYRDERLEERYLKMISPEEYLAS